MSVTGAQSRRRNGLARPRSGQRRNINLHAHADRSPPRVMQVRRQTDRGASIQTGRQSEREMKKGRARERERATETSPA